MAKTTWFNDNENRAFPFVAGTAGQVYTTGSRRIYHIPNATFVDMGFVMGVNSGFVEGEHIVYLSSVTYSRSSHTSVFTFKCTAPRLITRYLQLYVSGSLGELPKYSTWDFAHAGPKIPHYLEDDCLDDEMWSGYAVFGDLTPLKTLIGYYNSLSYSPTVRTIVEPALIHNLANSYARTLNLACADRTRATRPDGCRDLCWPVPPQPIWIRDTCLTGHVRWQEGKNCQIRQDDAQNAIIIGAMKGGGEPPYGGETCEEIPLYDGEEPPPGRSRLDGALRCSEVMRTINGVGGRVVMLQAGAGVNISPDPDNSEIVIDVNMHSMAACGETEPDESENCSWSESYDPCACGPE